MLIESDYKGFRIEVHAEQADGAWNAEVRIRRTLSEMAPHVLMHNFSKADAAYGAGVARGLSLDG